MNKKKMGGKEMGAVKSDTEKILYGDWLKLSQILTSHVEKKGNCIEDVRRYLKDIRKGK